MSNYEDRKIQILETPGVTYQDTKFEMYPKVLRQAVRNKEISHQAGWLWLTLSELAGSDREAYAGQEYLAEALGTSVPTIKRWTTELEKTGWLVKQNRTATSNKYWLSIPMEYDVLDKNYIARISTVGQELSTGKRSTRAKNPPAVEGYSHKLTDEPMKNEPMDGVHKLTDELSNKLTDEPMDKLTDELLKRQSIKETELNDTELSSYQGVTNEENQGEALVTSGEALDSPDSSLSSGETKSPGYSSVTKKEVILGPSKVVDVDNDKVTKALEERRAKQEMKKAAAPGYRRDSLATPQKAPEAPQSVVDAKGAPEGQTVPEKPQMPVYVEPERKDWEDDNRYESRKLSAWKSFVQYTMPNYKKALADWEKASTENQTTPTPVSEEFKAQMIAKAQERQRFRAQAY